MRFVVVTDSANTSDRERDIITALLEGKGWSVWHWFKDLWLIDEAPDDLDAQELREEIHSLLPKRGFIMIMSTEGDKWHSGSVQAEGVAWLNEHWRHRNTSR